jgi:uncharacterized Zn-finger protein
MGSDGIQQHFDERESSENCCSVANPRLFRRNSNRDALQGILTPSKRALHAPKFMVPLNSLKKAQVIIVKPRNNNANTASPQRKSRQSQQAKSSHLKPHVCELCRKSFPTTSKLRIHIRTHTHEKPFACQICDKRFSQVQHVKRHMVVHTGVKNHSCNICGKRFSSTSGLNEHKRIHTGEKPYNWYVLLVIAS